MGLLLIFATLGQSTHAADGDQTKLERIRTQSIAALGDPGATRLPAPSWQGHSDR